MRDDLVLYEKNRKIIQKAISYIKVLKSNNKFSFVELKPITGRKHQLRKQLRGNRNFLAPTKKNGLYLFDSRPSCNNSFSRSKKT